MAFAWASAALIALALVFPFSFLLHLTLADQFTIPVTNVGGQNVSAFFANNTYVCCFRRTVFSIFSDRVQDGDYDWHAQTNVPAPLRHQLPRPMGAVLQLHG